MATEFFIPKLGQTVEEVTLVDWLVPDGSKVDFGQSIMDVETDKAVFPVEANAKGYLHIGPYKAGDVVPVLTVVATIGKQDETFSAGGAPAGEALTAAATEAVAGAAEAAPTPTASKEAAGKVFASPRARKLAAANTVDLSQVPPTGGAGVRVIEKDVVNYLEEAAKAIHKATPLAARVAAVEGVDLAAVPGSGPGGKVTKSDVVQTIEASRAAPVAAPILAPAPLPAAEVVERIPLKGVRAIIAERMGTSVHTTAHVTMFMDVDATEFVAARERIKARVSEAWGFSPGYNDLLAKIVAQMLRQFPYMNARLAPDAIELLGHVNIGLAVDTERGLLVLVMRDADRKTLREFGAEFREKLDRARKGRSLPDDLSGGSFTITNLGMYEIEGFTPVINLPEAAILGVGKIIPKPVARGSTVEIRQMMTLSLVFDHRVVDGAPAARFMQAIKAMVEEPYLLIAG